MSSNNNNVIGQIKTANATKLNQLMKSSKVTSNMMAAARTRLGELQKQKSSIFGSMFGSTVGGRTRRHRSRRHRTRRHPRK